MQEDLFDSWNEKKKKLNKQKNYQHPKVGEIWWCSIGMNIGAEIYRKGSNYARPVLVVSSKERWSFIGLPLSSRLKPRRFSCVIKSDNGKLHSVLVYQIRNFDRRRLMEKMSEISGAEYEKVIKCLKDVFL